MIFIAARALTRAIMHPSISKDYLTLITILLVSTSCVESTQMDMERRLADSSDPRALGSPLEPRYWEYLLREFLFKTISPPPPANNMLYKELLEAPFYGGPFSTPKTLNDDGTSQILSRGDIYQLAEGGWIICQEGCTECEICIVQKTLSMPMVKWILRRIKRRVSFTHPERYDLQLTISPQADDSVHMKNLYPGSYVYVTSNEGAVSSFTDTLIRQNKEYSLQYPFHTTKPSKPKTPGRYVFSSDKNENPGFDQKKIVTQGPGTDNEVFQTELQLEVTSTLSPKVQSFPGKERSRETLQGGLTQRRIEDKEDNPKQGFTQLKPLAKSTPFMMFYPPTSPTVQSIGDNCRPIKDTRLIFGRDQFGEKHLVHVVPAGDLDAGIPRTSVHLGTRFVYRQPARPHPVQIEHEDRSLYRKIFRRIIDSLNTHKNSIEKFLFSPKREASFEQPLISSSSVGTFYEEGKAALNYDEDNTMRIASAQNIDESENTDATGNKSRSVIDNGEDIIGYSEKTSLTTFTTMKVLNEADEVSTESNHDTVQVTEDQTQETNRHLRNFDENNSGESLLDEMMKRQNHSETWILKEVAKSVVNHPDTLYGLNLTSLHRESGDPVSTVSESITGSAKYSENITKSRRHV